MNAIAPAPEFTAIELNGQWGVKHRCRGQDEFLPCDMEEDAKKCARHLNSYNAFMQSTYWEACEAKLKML